MADSYHLVMRWLALFGLALMVSTVHAQPYATRACKPDEFRKSPDQVRRELHFGGNLDDAQLASAVHQAFYPDLSTQEVACSMGVKLPDPPPPKKKLGPIDQWRYDACRTDAAKAPTERGVTLALNLCRENFNQ